MTTFHTFLRTAAERHGDNPAILFEGSQLSHAELLARAEGLAAGLAMRGIDVHARLALIMDNSIECLLSWLASALTGCTDIPINPQYRGELLRYLLDDSGATDVICDSRYLDNLLAVAPRLPALRRIFVNGEASARTVGALSLIPLSTCETYRAFEAPGASDERLILYTSGTTGPSKGVIHSQKAMLDLARYNAEVLGYGPQDRLLNFFPLFHQNARYTGVIPALCAGASIRIERKLSTSRFWNICDADGITAFNYLGSVLRMILNVSGPERRKGTHTITRAFGAGASPTVWRQFEERLGIQLYETYGLSEAPMATINVPGPDRCPPGSAGKASALFEVCVLDDSDKPVLPGEIGEIALRPKRPDAFMLGYHGKDAATLQATRNLWFHSGDRGHLSPEGYLYFEERMKDSIRRRGENISAWEVESVLELHPQVAEAAVYGLPCGDDDEEVAVSLVPADDAFDLTSLCAFARANLPAYAVPTLLRLAKDLPRTPTAKVKKDELRALPRDAYSPVPAHGPAWPAPARDEV